MKEEKKIKTKIKTYVITLSKNYMKGHPKEEQADKDLIEINKRKDKLIDRFHEIRKLERENEAYREALKEKLFCNYESIAHLILIYY